MASGRVNGKVTKLWSGSSYEGKYNLSQPYTEFGILIVECVKDDPPNNEHFSEVVATAGIAPGTQYHVDSTVVYNGAVNNCVIGFKFPSETEIQFIGQAHNGWGIPHAIAVYGV